MNETSSKSWRRLRHLLVTCAVLATFIAVFYAEENWRGKRDWEKYKHDLEAQGLIVDWEQLIPPPVPDDQNFFKASSKITYSFVHSRNDAEAEFFAKQPRLFLASNHINYAFPKFTTASNGPVLVAQLAVIPTTGVLPQSGNVHRVLKLNDPADSAEAARLMADTIGLTANGSQGFKFSQHQLSSLVPTQMVVSADDLPSVHDLENFLGLDTLTNLGRLQVISTSDSAQFKVQLRGVSPVTSVGDFLKWSDQFGPDFVELQTALKRPYARIDGDYSDPHLMPLPNFVTMRMVAQLLAERTQCQLLLGRPDAALHELTLMNDERRILGGAPTGKPMTLVSAMINVAIAGVYADTIAYGLHYHLWPEPQLAAIQSQLKDVALLPWVAESIREQIPNSSYMLGKISPAELDRLHNLVVTDRPVRLTTASPGFWQRCWQRLKDPGMLVFRYMPRGWIYQNMRVTAQTEQKWTLGIDPTNSLIQPAQMKKTALEVAEITAHWSLWNIWLKWGSPYLSKAALAVARNQTTINEAQIVCALERYHLVHGEYPETLAGLMPQFIETIPHDLISGQPLHYRRTPDGQFLLYSIGWNETDDGGQTAYTKKGVVDRENGDWVWQYPTANQ
jgi:hypothetical protein